MAVKSSKTRIFAVLTLFALAVFGLVQVTGAGPSTELSSTHEEDFGRTEALVSEQCALTVSIQGNGEVSALTADQKSVRLTTQSNDVPVACAETVQLTAQPLSLNRFVKWEGVPDTVAHKYRISVAGGADVTAVFVPREILRYETLDTPYLDRAGRMVSEVPIYESVWRALPNSEQAETALPQINVWYGDSQTFGDPGLPQIWANVLGNVSDNDGDLSKLEYKLNGDGPFPLNVGGDGHAGDGLRLYNQGDFNIDILYSSLNPGPNNVLIIATDSLGGVTERPVTVIYDTGNSWPLNYDTNWAGAASLQSEAQIVDGHWEKISGGITPVETGFDRAFAIGEMNSWSDFEVTVPVKILGFSEEGFSITQNRPALGILMRWKGHTDTPDLCDQPLCGYYPNGSVAWYEFISKNSQDGQFSMWSKTNDKTLDLSGKTLTWGKTYMWKVRSQSLEGTTGRYSMKIWDPATQNENQVDWLLTRDGIWDSYATGSVLILAHHVDVVIGNVSVEPYDSAEGPPEISVDEIVPEPHGTIVTWFTDEPSIGRVDYGTDTTYGDSIQSNVSGTRHSVFISNLAADSEYHLRIWAKDSSDLTETTDDIEFRTQESVQIVSDDFNRCTLGPNWMFIDPLADGGYDMNGTHISVSVPAGSNHDIWPPGPPVNRAPRIMQQVTDPDNLKVKFDTGIDAEVAQQGIIIEEDESNFMRINYQFENGQMKLVVVGFKSGFPPSILRTVNLNGASPEGPFYLWLKRNEPGNLGMWQVQYSTDDVNWSSIEPFAFPLSVSMAGFYAGNVNKTPGSEPAFTTAVDYWFNANAPIDPEDGTPLQLPVNIVGNGSVSSDRTCGNPVILTAQADPGWYFYEWQGSSVDGLISLQVEVEYEAGDEVTAVFAEGEPETYTLDVQSGNGEGTVAVTPNKVEYIRGEVVQLEAVPADGWAFESWGGDLSGSDPVQEITMDADKAIVANFTVAQLTLDVTIVGPGQVQLSPPGPYEFDQQVTLTAVPAVGSLATFAGWSGDVTSTDNPLQLIITENMEVTATFFVYRQFLPFAISQESP